jgi:hypothetical protein
MSLKKRLVIAFGTAAGLLAPLVAAVAAYNPPMGP